MKPFQFVGVLKPRLSDPRVGFLSVELGARAGEIGLDARLKEIEVQVDDVLRRARDTAIPGSALLLQLKVLGKLRGAYSLADQRGSLPRLRFPAFAIVGGIVEHGDTVLIEGPAHLTVKVTGLAVLSEGTDDQLQSA